MGSQVMGREAAARLRSLVLFGGVVALGGGLFAWKYAAAQGSAAGAQYEPAEVVTVAVAEPVQHQGAATSIGTVLATRSITLRNELPGTVRQVALRPGQLVEAGSLLVALDVSVETAELKAQQARAELAERTVERLQRMADQQAISAMELDNARAERDVARAEVERIRAVIGRKTIRAPFRARVGMSDVHVGQFLDAGTLLTTLQGVEAAADVDFAVAQAVAAGLRPGDVVQVFVSDDGLAVPARVSAVDARIDPSTRNATVRARLDAAGAAVSPGSSVRVRVPVGEAHAGVVVPVGSLRKGPDGDHVFVLEEVEGQTRSVMRRVQAGAVLGEGVLILQGLSAGERVAASGSFKLREGALVQVSSEPTVTAGVR
jgi:membrane fusion protein, multidrug efflux system